MSLPCNILFQLGLPGLCVILISEALNNHTLFDPWGYMVSNLGCPVLSRDLFVLTILRSPQIGDGKWTVPGVGFCG